MPGETVSRQPTLKRFLYKGCDRCGGDLTLSEDGHGWRDEFSYVCLQCGRHMPVQGVQAKAAESREHAA